MRVLHSARQSLLLAEATDVRYQALTNCDLRVVGEEFNRKPYALAVQQGSPLKDQLNEAYVTVKYLYLSQRSKHII